MKMDDGNASKFWKKMQKGEFERVRTNLDQIQDILWKEFASEEDLSAIAQLIQALGCVYGIDYSSQVRAGVTTNTAVTILSLVEFLIKHERIVKKLMDRIPRLEVEGI